MPDSDGVDDDEEEVPVDDEDTCTTEVPETPLVEDTEEREIPKNVNLSVILLSSIILGLQEILTLKPLYAWYPKN